MAYASALLRQGRAPESLEATDELVGRLPLDGALARIRAAALYGSGDHDGALSAYDSMLARAPRNPMAWLGRGRVSAALGRGAEAAEAFRRSLAAEPDLAEAYWSLADLKTVPFTRAEVQAMTTLGRRPDLSDADKIHLDFALAKSAEDTGDFEAAFTAYARANALRRASVRYGPGRVRDHCARSRDLFSADFFETRSGWGKADDPGLGGEVIFIVGLPRAGSTLVEQVLASHSQIEAVGELPTIAHLARRLNLESSATYPERLADLTARDFRDMGETYLADAGRYRRLGRPLFIDKAPNNFLHLGLIRLALPAARIVDVRRGAMACCVSCFRQHFAAGQAFAYDLADLGRYYADYAALMEHFDAVLPRKPTRVRYESLVKAPAEEIRRLFDALDLSLEPACLLFHEGDRAVRTPSTLQVRRPVTTVSIDAWRRYEPWLDPLRAALGPLAVV